MGVPVAVGLLLFVAVLLALAAPAAARRERALALVGASQDWLRARRRVAAGPRPGRLPLPVAALLAGSGLGVLGLLLVGPVGAVAGAAVGAAIPSWSERRRKRRGAERLERQVAEAAESIALGLRSGRSVALALEAAASELGPPLGEVLGTVVRERRLGIPLGRALRGLEEAVGTEEGRMLVLLLEAGTRSGGNLSRALEELATAARHRASLRRELLALSAQGRISGAVLGFLPVGFFVLVAASSRAELAPVLRSVPGMAMVAAGLVLEALGFVWIGRILAVAEAEGRSGRGRHRGTWGRGGEVEGGVGASVPGAARAPRPSRPGATGRSSGPVRVARGLVRLPRARVPWRP